jgi:hypothetical protein
MAEPATANQAASRRFFDVVPIGYLPRRGSDVAAE